MPAPTTPAQYALILIDLARERGIDSAALLAGSGLAAEGLSGIGARVSDSEFRQLAENALELTREPALGLHLGQRLNLSAHAVLGQAFMTCSNLAEVMQLFERYYHLLAPDLELNFSRGEGRCSISTAAPQAGLPITFGLEVITAAMRNTLSGLLGGTELSLRFEFPYPAPAHVAEYHRILGPDLHFDRPLARWSFDLALLQSPLPTSNPALRQLYENECARLLADLEHSLDLSAQTRRLLRKLEGQYPKMPQLASLLNMTARTYRRRLAAEGTSFQALLDEVRAEHATRYLRDTRLPIASIAYQLGFNDPSNFRRAYRRWTGRPPADVRETAGGSREPAA
jgi:AraC-like DNA-binding protein